MDDLSIAVDAATDAAQRKVSDAQLEYGAKFDRVASNARACIVSASGATLAQMMVEEMSAAEYQRHLDALLAAVRNLAHGQVREHLHLAARVASAWDVIEDCVVGRVAGREMKQ